MIDMTATTRNMLLSVSMALALTTGVTHAQTHDTHGKSSAHAELAAWTLGEVKKVDVAQKKITIKHEDIKSLQMPGMTMIFHVKSTKLLEGLSADDPVKFMATQEGGRYFVTDIQLNR